MDKQLSIQIINEAIDLAIKKGCYNLIEVTNIVNALNFINNENNEQSTNDK